MDYTIRMFNHRTQDYTYHVFYNTTELEAVAMCKADHPHHQECGRWPYVLDICKLP